MAYYEFHKSAQKSNSPRISWVPTNKLNTEKLLFMTDKGALKTLPLVGMKIRPCHPIVKKITCKCKSGISCVTVLAMVDLMFWQLVECNETI
jgi:hypothetical protein